MTRWRITFALFAAIITLTAPGFARADTVVRLFSTPGVKFYTGYDDDLPGFTGHGEETFSATDGWEISAVKDPFISHGVYIRLSRPDTPRVEILEFAAAGSAHAPALATGNYPGGVDVNIATLAPYPPVQGFSGVGYANREFQVLDIGFDATGAVDRFAANFVFRDKTDPTIAIYGEIRLDSAIPLDQGAAYVQFAQGTYAASEGSGAVPVTVLRAGGVGSAATVHYETLTTGTAKAGVNYTPVSGMLTWAAGDAAAKTFLVPILENTVIDGGTTLDLALTGDVVAGAEHATVSIADNDPLPGSIAHFRIFTTAELYTFPTEVTVTDPGRSTFVANANAQGAIDINVPNRVSTLGTIDFQFHFAPKRHKTRLKPGDFSGNYPGSGQRFYYNLIGNLANLHEAAAEWQILQVNYGADGKLLQLAVNFETRDAAGQLVVQGELRYQSDLPLRAVASMANMVFQAKRSASALVATVERTGDVTQAISVDYATVPYSAVAGVDYADTHGTLAWAAGDGAARSISVPLLHNPAAGSHTFFVQLTGGARGGRLMADATVLDDRLTAPALLPEPDGRLDRQYSVLLANDFRIIIGALKALPDGRAYIGGNFATVNDQLQQGITRLGTDGTPDASFKSPLSLGNASGMVNGIALLPDGRLLVAGRFSASGAATPLCVARLGANGSLDADFAASATQTLGTAQSVTLQPDGRIILAGAFEGTSGLIRLNADGTRDGSFSWTNDGENPRCVFALLQPDGHLMVADQFGSITRLNADGSLDAAYHSSLSADTGLAHVTVLQPDGKIVFVDRMESRMLDRLNVDGTLDADFSGGQVFIPAAAEIESLELQPDGKLLVGVAAQGGPGVQRLNADGSADTTFVSANGVPKVVRAMALLADGSLLASGGFETAAGDPIDQTVFAKLAGAAPMRSVPLVTVAVNAARAVKATHQAGQFTITRTGDLTVPLKVRYVVEGDAAAGVDFAALSGHKKLKPGHDTAVITITPLDGLPGRGRRTVQVRLLDTALYNLGSEATADVVIVDAPTQ